MQKTTFLSNEEPAIDLFSLLCHLCILSSATCYQDMAGRFWCSILLLPDFYYCIHLDTLLADLSSSTPPQAACLGSSPHPPVFVPLLGRTPYPCLCCDGTSTVRQLTGAEEEHEGLQNDVNENGTLNILTRSFWTAFRDSKACPTEAMKSSTNRCIFCIESENTFRKPKFAFKR